MQKHDILSKVEFYYNILRLEEFDLVCDKKILTPVFYFVFCGLNYSITPSTFFYFSIIFYFFYYFPIIHIISIFFNFSIIQITD